jgi:hypothetical protein
MFRGISRLIRHGKFHVPCAIVLFALKGYQSPTTNKCELLKSILLVQDEDNGGNNTKADVDIAKCPRQYISRTMDFYTCDKGNHFDHQN